MAPTTPTRHVGLDLGGTNLKWVVVERADGTWRAVDRGSVATDVARGEATIVPQLARVAADAVRSAGGAVSVGLGVPGLYLPDEGQILFLPNTPGTWADVPVVAPIREAAGVPTALINDARAFGLAELRLGAGRGARTMIGLTLGTGVGGVVCVDGRVHLGYRGTGGELGHQTLDPDGPWCGCGNRGCLEAYARADQLSKACGAPDPEEALRRAAAGDPLARQGFADVGRYLGIGIANMIVALTPDRVVLGGGVSAAGDLLIAPIRAEIDRRVRVTDGSRVQVVLAELGTWAGAIGAAVHGAEQAEAAGTGR
jgi:glucokinase